MNCIMNKQNYMINNGKRNIKNVSKKRWKYGKRGVKSLTKKFLI